MGNQWMYSQDHRFQIGDRVRLRPDIDPAIYGEYACVGNEGFVRQQDKDKFGLPQIYLQWDKNHWAYNGASDTLTVEDHFELVETSMEPSKKDQINDIVSMFGQALSAVLSDDETQPVQQVQPAPQAKKPDKASSLIDRFQQAVAPLQGEKDRETEDEAQFNELVVTASNAISECEAFMVVGVTKADHLGAPSGMLKPFVIGDARSPEASILVSTHLAQLAANAHKDLAVRHISQMSNES